MSGDKTANVGSVHLVIDGHVAIMTLDRPEKLNTFTLPMVRQIEELSRRLQEDASVRAVVVTGAGEQAFSAGGDLETLLPAATEAGVDIVNPDPRARFFSGVFKPIVAAVRGVCIGGGLELMLGTDIRIAGADSVFGLGEVRWGLIAGAGSHVRLPRQVPWATAMELLLLGRTITAERALAVGLVNEITEPDQVLDRALEIATTIAANAPLAVQTAKEIAVRSLQLEEAFELEHTLNSRVLRSDDAREGPAAFRERRVPRFQGQ